jgi:hypothetical protein
MENKYRVVHHISNKHVLNIHLLYDVKNAMHTRVVQHVSDARLLNRHLLYDVRNTYSTLEWFTTFQMPVFLTDTNLTM